MTRTPLQDKDNFDCRNTNQVKLSDDSSVNHALVAVAQEVAELLKQANLVQVDDRDRTGTTAVRPVED